MIIRNGNYTILDEYDCALYEVRQEAPIDFIHFVVRWYFNQVCSLEGLKLSVNGDITRIFKRSNITNSYSVKTKELYKGDEVQLWRYNENRNVIGLMTFSGEIAKKHNFLKLSDRYIKEFNSKELDSIWDERSKSEFDLPIPTGIESKKIITPTL